MTEVSFRTSRLFKILGNPLRYRILMELFQESLTPGELAVRVHRPLHAVSRNLGILLGAHLVSYRTVGAAPVYRVPHGILNWYVRQGEDVVREVEGMRRADAGLARRPRLATDAETGGNPAL